MTKRFSSLLACAALALSGPAFAQDAPVPAAAPPAKPATVAPATTDADPALWVVKDEDTTIYLFGTVHVLKPGLSWFDEAVKTAFDKSDELVLEIAEPDPAAIQPLMMRLGVDATQKALSETLPADKGAAYLKAMTAMGLPQTIADKFKPWLAATILSVAPLQKLGYTAENGPEHILTAAATKDGKKLGALETAEQQFGYLAGLSEDAQLEFLSSTLDDQSRLSEMMGEMVGDWSRGDPDALAKLLNDSVDDNPELARTLLSDRNARWTRWIEDRLKQPGTLFIAVGAGHLAGPTSVRAMLAKDHITATRIPY